MKIKFNKKLGINKSTVSNLNDTAMSQMKGGTRRTYYECSNEFCDSRPWDTECAPCWQPKITHDCVITN